MPEENNGLGAAIILVISPQGIPFVRNTQKSEVLWRLPGGHIEFVSVIRNGLSYLIDEKPRRAASRELREETGFIVHRRQIRVVQSEFIKDHTRYLCFAKVDGLGGTQLQIGNGGEEIKLFSIHEALYNKNFLPSHRKLIKPYLTMEMSKYLSQLKPAN